TDYDRMIELGVAYLRNRFTNLTGHAWVESCERTIALAYANEVPLTAILSMGDAGARTLLSVLRERIEDETAFRDAAELLFRLRSLECE
ncbi:hypothetical protein NL359_35630, partial [Klebsiella pneumoniae]|nr:hypothetical protein [Klebsiella pneumoniae]